MSDMIYYKNGEETFRISPPTVETKCPKTKLEVKKMTEIEKTEGEIKVLQAKLELLKEMEKHKTPCEIAYKRVYGNYPTGEHSWIVFKKGYEASKEDYKVGEYQPTLQEPTPNKFLQRILDGKIDERGYVDLRDPTSTVFRQKLFDGIKSVFYDPDYERTNWKMKVNMAVDEVLTHFYDIIPDEFTTSSINYNEGWNNCIDNIKFQMELVE
jgi:hypothetical protein